ncbi:PEGA domain-containing protein [Methanogenium marinum]|uniref:PEGA domain-containing protein n=1 Tax=Methanogenium marinum TaxID=348610 RepID=UPI002381B984|nr:PEGA domain-containing protein [Methanogenium marinum]
MDNSIVNKIVYGRGFSGHGTAKILFAAVFVAMVVLTGVASAGSSLYSGGAGTSDDPYQISNSTDIKDLSTDSANWDKYFIVTNDIDLAGDNPTTTIGNYSVHYYSQYFSGTFDGQGHTIRNFRLSLEGYYVGLFGYVNSDGEIRNLNVETDADGISGKSYVGVVVGRNEYGSLTNCSATGSATATANSYVGGLVGYNNYGTLTNCSATGSATATANSYAGGLVGCNNYGTLTNCSATGNATAMYYAGGLVGYNTGSLENCSATGSATATATYAGGLVGYNTGSLENCSATGSATARSGNVGGLVGFSTGSLTNCSATGSATARNDYVGGLVGYSTGSLTNCSATGAAAITFTGDYAGGLVGYNTGSLTNCCATGDVTAIDYNAGGLVGYSTGSLTNCSATGSATACAVVGGLVGRNQPGGSLTNCSATGNVTARLGNAGGLVGGNFGGTLTKCSATGNAYAVNGDSAGGLAGHNDGTIIDCSATGNATAEDYYVGGLVGYNTGPLTNCSATGTAYVANGNSAGGLVGFNWYSEARITNCYATGSATATGDYAGGLVGWNYGSYITNCYATGDATATLGSAGGLVGKNEDNSDVGGYITDCYATGDADAGSGGAGGLVGYNAGGSLENCYATGNATATGDCAGGLVGRSSGSITNCSATGNAAATGDCAGGLVGKTSGSLNNCYATGTATATGDYAGGLVGHSDDDFITNCYATGTATASNYAGGLAGYNDGQITNCYATGSATASNYAGGLVGYNDGYITDCYATGDASATGSYAGGLVGKNDYRLMNCYATGTATASNYAGGVVGNIGTMGMPTNCYRYTNGDNSYGTLITDITKFKDYDFLTGSDLDNGLKWDTGIISMDADSSKTWRVSVYNAQYPFFQWQSFENGTFEVHSSPAGATIYLNGESTGESTNYTFLSQPVGDYTITVAEKGYLTPDAQTVTLTNAGLSDPVTFSLTPIVHPMVWSVSHIAGSGNYTDVSAIPEIGDGDTIQIWGTEGHTYEGGFTIDAADVTIEQWDGSPVRPLLTNTLQNAPAINIAAGNVTLQGLNISENTYAGAGAGVHAEGTISTHLQGLTITDCVFAGNEVSSAGSEDAGGAVFIAWVDNCRITDTTFENNIAGEHGGAMYASKSVNLLLTDSVCRDNSASYRGGGVYFRECPAPVLTRMTFENNTATDTDDSAKGGALSTYDTDNVVVTDSTFANNTAYNGGGCLFQLSDNLQISNTTYTGNTVLHEGGGCYLLDSDDVEFVNITAGTSTGDDFSATTLSTGVSFTNLTLCDDEVSTSVTFTFEGAMQIAGTHVTPPANPAGYENISHFVDVTAPGWMLLNVSYIDADVAGLNESSLTMWKTTGDGWGEVAGTNGVNTAEKYVFANLTGIDEMHTVAPFANVMGELRITSAPSGGWIWIDGVNRSVQTNASVSGIFPDVNHNVTVVLDDYYPGINESVNVSQCGTTPVFFDLVYQTGDLQINSTPAGATIFLNEVATGNFTNFTFDNKPIGEYNVTVVKPGYDTKTATVTLTNATTGLVDFTLVQQVGILQVNSTPTNASIYLNEVATGESTNFTFDNQPIGEYNVTVVKPGYDTKTATVTLTNATTELVDFTLVQQVGILQVNSTPTNASIYLNEVATGNFTNFTFANKPIGEYNVTVVKPGYDTQTETVTLTNATTKQVDFTLEQQVGILQVNSTPTNASIYLNEVATGESTNFTFDNKPIGEYNVTVVKPGYGTKTETVTLTNAVTKQVDFSLVQQTGILQVNSNPTNASIYLNEVATGECTNFTFDNKPIGEYNVTVVKPDYGTKTETVTLTNAVTKQVDFSLVQQTGILQVNSNPTNASIYLNEVATGESTNFTFDNQSVGDYNVTVVKSGYGTKTETVTLTNATTKQVDFTLEQQVGILQVNSTPTNASIYLNEVATGESTNFTFDNQPVGEYNVTVVKSGYGTMTETVTLTNAVTKQVDFSLEQQTGILQVNSTPADATIYLNGVATGESTNFTFDNQPVGEYNVTVVKSGYGTMTETVTLTNAVTKQVDFSLEQQTGILQVNSTPADATIYLNGVATGESTNFTFDNQPVGEYNVTVVKSGYGTMTETVTLTNATTKQVDFSLEQQTGILQVNSTPADATIYLNGISSGFTNTTLNDLATGTYNVTVVLEGYETAINDSVTVTNAVTTPVFFDLVHQTGGLKVNSTPADASIWLDGENTGKFTNTTLTNIPTGTHDITVEKSGYLTPANKSVMVEKGETAEISFVFGHESGSIQVTSTPADATIWLDGENTGEFTNTTLGNVPIGIHTITVEKTGFLTPVTRSITVEKDEVTDVSFTLTQQAGSISVTSSPEEAWIWLDGGNTTVLTNTTLPTIPVGSHDIRLVKSLYYNTTIQSVIVSENQTADVSFTLTPVGSEPVASFTATPLSGDAPLQVTFTDTSTGSPDVWNWSFGDGNYSEVQNPVHTYTNEGAYDVSLTTGNAYGTGSVTTKDYIVVSGTPAIRLSAPSGRIPANDTAEFPITADGLDGITELSFTIAYDPAFITVEDIAPASLTVSADFTKTIDNANGLVTIGITDDIGITADSASPVADITFRATESISGLRETAKLTITDAHAENAGIECPVVRNDGAIDVEARTVIGAPNGTLPVESSKYLTVSASALNDVKNLSFIMEFNRTVMSVTDVRANGTISGLLVDSVIKNENGWLKVSATAPDTITGIESIPLVDINVHSNGLPGEYEIRLVNPCWTRDNATYRFDDLKPGYISITPVHASLTDDQPVTVANMTFDDDTQEVSINLAENQNATITGDNTTIIVRNPGIDITIQTGGLQNVSSEWTGECTGAEIGNISGSADLGGDVGNVSTGISADISGGLSALMNPDTGLDVTITRGAVNETMGRAFQLGVLDQMGAELEEVAYTMEINKSAFGGITVTDAVIVMSAPELYVNAWGGADDFTIMSMAHDGSVTMLETTYTYADGVYTFTALSPDGFSFKALVSFSVNEAPLATFSAVPVAGMAPLPVQFYDYSSGRPDSWAWDFGDGETSTEQNPVHTYTTTGVYDVALTVTNVVGEDTTEEVGYITTTNPMAVDFTATPVTGYAPFAVTFTDETTESPSAWLWEFGDGETSVEQNPVHTYQSVGVYTVSLTATNAYGSKTAEKERFVTVSYPDDGGDSDDSTPFVAPKPTPTPTPTPTPVPTTSIPTPESTVTTPSTPAVANPNEFIGTALLPVGPDGATQRPVTIRADDTSGYLTIDAGVTARDASGILQENISIVAVPVTAIPSPGTIGLIEHSRALYAYSCTPEGVSFTPAITLTFTLSEEEWDVYGDEAQAAWFNTTSGEWEVIAGVADADARTITIQISHFSTYALFAEVVPEVPLPDMTGIPAGSSGGSSLWLWGLLLVALVAVGGLLISRRQNK